MIKKLDFLQIYDECFFKQRKINNAIYCDTEIPNNKLKQALSSYIVDWNKADEALMLFDNSMFGTGGSGFILTTKKLYAEGYPRDFELNISEIKSAELSHDVIILNGRFIMKRITEETHVEKLLTLFQRLAQFLNPPKEVSTTTEIPLPATPNYEKYANPNKAVILPIEIETKTVKEPEQNDTALWLTSEFKIIQSYTKLITIEHNRSEIDHALFAFGIYLASMNDEIDCMPLFYGHMHDIINAMSAQEINISEILLLESTDIDQLLATKENVKIRLNEEFKAFLNTHKFSTTKQFTTLLLKHLFDSDTVKITEIEHSLLSNTPKNSR